MKVLESFQADYPAVYPDEEEELRDGESKQGKTRNNAFVLIETL